MGSGLDVLMKPGISHDSNSRESVFSSVVSREYLDCESHLCGLLAQSKLDGVGRMVRSILR